VGKKKRSGRKVNPRGLGAKSEEGGAFSEPEEESRIITKRGRTELTKRKRVGVGSFGKKSPGASGFEELPGTANG